MGSGMTLLTLPEGLERRGVVNLKMKMQKSRIWEEREVEEDRGPMCKGKEEVPRVFLKATW